MGGTSPNIDYMVAKAIWVRADGAGTYSVALYTGGDLGDPTGATRISAIANQSLVEGWNRVDCLGKLCE